MQQDIQEARELIREKSDNILVHASEQHSFVIGAIQRNGVTADVYVGRRAKHLIGPLIQDFF